MRMYDPCTHPLAQCSLQQGGGGWDYHKERIALLKSYYYHPPTLSRRAVAGVQYSMSKKSKRNKDSL